jgi:pimeloyl-ACP methyl ester carboxylesterase
VGSLILGLVVAGPLAGASAAGPRDEPAGDQATVRAAVAQPAPAPKIPARYLKQKFRWRMCSFDDLLRESIPGAGHTRCTKLKVPMDWRRPSAHPDISIAIAYSKASGPRSLGLLTTNLGGPGLTGRSAAASLARRNNALMAQYDLLGFDPRGFGASTQVRCRTSAAKVKALPTVADHRARTKATHKAERARAKLLAKSCSSSTFSRYVSTQQTVYDLNFLRAFLNKRTTRAGRYPKLNYIGYSYGTWLGAWFADTYPTRVGRFVLDSNLDWTADMNRNERMDAAALQRRRDQMFYPWVARRNAEYGYGATAAAVGRHYEQSRAKLVSLYERGFDVPSPEDMDHVIADLLPRNNDFLEALTYLLQLDEVVTWTDAPLEATGGQPARAYADRVNAAGRTLQRSLQRRVSPSASGSELQVGTRARALTTRGVEDAESDILRCNDSAYPRDVTQVLRDVDAAAAAYSFLGYASGVSMCSYWPHRPTPRTIDLARVPTMLMIQAEGDPVTAYEGAVAAHRVGHTRLVSVDNEGQHSLYIGGPSTCVQKVGDAFLFSGRMPARDLTCGTRPLPRDRAVFPLDGPVTG